MKKILFLSAIAVLALSIACNKDKERTEQTFNVEIYRVEDSVEVAPEQSGIILFDGSLEFDWTVSCSSEYGGGEGKMTLVDGNRVSGIEVLGETGKHTLENIKDGEYWIFIYCPINHNTADKGLYSVVYRKIIIDKDTHNTTLKFVFTDDERLWHGFCGEGSIRFVEK